MKCLILAAGYATRLYPLTENFPKPLLTVGDKTILDWLVDDIDTAGLVREYVVISNHRYAPHFESWAKTKQQKITVLDDGTTSNETRLGAVKDIQFALETLHIDEDVLVIAGDNVLDFSLTKLLHYAKGKGTSCVMRYYEAEEARLKKSGVAQVDENDLVLSLEEKPALPKSHWCTPPFYYYTREDARLVGKGIAEGCGTDAPGSYIAWLCRQTRVHSMQMPGKRYDIGNLDSYRQVQETYRGDRPMLTPNVNLDNCAILVTGAAGFIGANLVLDLLETTQGSTIVGLDNCNDYYDPALKAHRLEKIETAAAASRSRWEFRRGDLANMTALEELFQQHRFRVVVNLAAQAGVRYSITNPDVYIQSNMVGFYNILECCRRYPVSHLVYASSSSVYGSNTSIPYRVEDKVDTPVSLYAATKKSNELFAHAYAKLYGIPATGLRFFTVYGPAGRPDMAYFGFTQKLLAGKTIQIFNYGNCKRDFTYVDDIVEGVRRVMERAPELKTGPDGLPVPPYRVYNIGNSSPENLLDFVQTLQEELVAARVLPEDFDFEAHKELVPMQAGDVAVTFADTSALEADTGFKPNTPLREGLRRFARWYKEFYG